MDGVQPSGKVAELDRGAANSLAAALSVHLAEGRGIRLLIVKGAVAEAHGLRPPRLSADVDVLVEPSRVGEFGDALREVGWSPRPETRAATEASAHSATFIHPDWPCDIDVHHVFPGLLEEPQAAFEALWSERATLDFAGVDCPAAGLLGSILIASLHALRHDSDDARLANELKLAGDVVDSLSGEQRTALVELAGATQSAGPLEEWLTSCGLEVEVRRTPELVDWETRRHSGDTFAGQLVAEVSKSSGFGRVRLLWLAFWPSEDELRATHPEIPAGAVPLLRARFARLGRGLRDLPRALRARSQSRGARG